MQSDRIVPKTAQATDTHIAASALRMNLVEVIEADPENEVPEERIFSTTDGKTSLHHIFDPQSGLSYVVLRGADIASHEAKLRDRMETFTLEEIQAEAAQAKGKAKVTAVYRLAIAAPAKFDRDTFDLLVKAMHDPERNVRHAAVWATAYSDWKEFRKPLQEVQAGDEDPGIREDAGTILQAMSENG
jgi:hypothetical protein